MKKFRFSDGRAMLASALQSVRNFDRRSKNNFISSAGTRGYSRLARVFTLAVMLLMMAAGGAQAKLAKVTFSGNNKTKTVYVGLPHAFWTNKDANSSNSYELDYIIAELWNKSAGYCFGNWTTEGSDKVTCSSSSTPQYQVRIITISDVFDGEATVSGKYMSGSSVLNITLTITTEEVDNSGWATDITAGQYYIVDATTNKMMAAGHDWSTRGIVSDQGLDLTLTPDVSSKTVTIDSRVSNGGDSHFLGNTVVDNALWMDGSAFGWGFVANGTGYSIYDCASQKYISVDANDNLVLSDTPRQFNLIPKADMLTQLKAKMATATKDAPVDATMLITAPNFNRNDLRNAEAWTVVKCEPWNYNPSGGNDLNNCAESYCSNFEIQQTINGAPAGTYQLTAQGFYRQDENKTQTVAAPYFFANGVNKDFPVIANSENSMTDASVSFTAGKYTISPIEFTVGDDGVMNLGVSSATASHWVVWDNFRLSYLGDPNAAEPAEEPGHVTLAAGTVDADNWKAKAGDATEFTALPLEGVAEGTKVTLQYNGRLKVKSVKATVDEKSDLLNGKFSVSATKQVQFAKGNLQATTTDLGETWTWGFAENQWDCIGDAAANNTINGIGTVSTNGTVDLFEWVGASSTWTGAAQYGISNSISGKTNGHGNVADEALKSDWGTTMGTGWRTLTSDEWLWIFGPIDSPNPGTNCRTSSTVGGTANGRFAKATVNGKAGVILFPDSYTHPDGVTAPANVNIGNSAAHYDGNNYNATDWGKMEAAGAVFLVAGGIRDFRNESPVLGAGNNCIYWSSSPFTSSADEACGIRIQNAGMNPQFDYFRFGGFAVRLVKDAQ